MNVKKILNFGIFLFFFGFLIFFVGCEKEIDNEVVCAEIYAPVCGVDGNTYSNKCVAEEINDVEVAYDGECKKEDLVGDDNDDNENNTDDLKTICENNGGNWIDSAKECEGISQELCSDMGGNFNSCASACRNDPDAQMCTLQCVLVCEFSPKEIIVGGDKDEHGCIGSAGYIWCESLDECIRPWETNCSDLNEQDNTTTTFCPMVYAPVCGVDGNTYSNDCIAQNLKEVEIAYSGECGIENAFSNPKICTKEYNPVCGADYVTYSNPCMAGNMTILYSGECEEFNQTLNESNQTFVNDTYYVLSESFVLNSQTYLFDGFDLKFDEKLEPDFCEDCFQYVFSFNSTHSGYGNRTNDVLAQVITPHEAIVTIEKQTITKAVLDSEWDMTTQKNLD
jgi:hypothetical protein